MGELTRTSLWKFPLSSIGPVFTVLFAVYLLPVNSLTSHSLGASAEYLLLALALRRPGPVSSPAVSFSPSRRSTHACWNVEAFVRRLRHTRKYTRAGRGCISIYFYARVIAPTVYFYPTRVICNEPPSDRAEGRGSRGLDSVLPSTRRARKKRSVDWRCRALMWRDVCEAKRIRSILLPRGSYHFLTWRKRIGEIVLQEAHCD